MAKKMFLLTLCLVAFAAGHASVNKADSLTASDVFAKIPLDVLDMIRPSVRLDMLDYYNQLDSMLVVQDALGGSCRLEKVTPDYLKVAVTPVSTLEIKILPAKKDRVIMTLYTVSSVESSDSGEGSVGRVSDTLVRFFDSSLNPLPSQKYLKAPALKDFFNLKGSGLSESDLKEKIPFTAISYTSGAGDVPLSATFTTLSSVSKEDRDLLTPLLIPSLSADWNQSYKFK